MRLRPQSKIKNRKSKVALDLLRNYESRNVTFLEPDGSWPIVWERARGVHVWDAEGRKYLDLTAAFGVAAAGHANPRVVRAGQTQMARLLHAMGDVHPHALKARLARALSRLTFERWAGPPPAAEVSFTPDARPSSQLARHDSASAGKTIFCNSGFEAVEAALKTAMLATGKPGVIAFAGAYHGLGYGALNATHRGHFRSPFLQQLGDFGLFVPFPAMEMTSGSSRASGGRPNRQPPDTLSSLDAVEAQIRRLFKRNQIGAVLVEPIQVRGGINIPPPDFLPRLRHLCNEYGAVLILDEIYTGFGRTGRWFACEHSDTVPDVICVGKALTGGFPLSACVGRSALMDAAWPASNGEAIHTSTYLGHPVGCAMALAQIHEIQTQELVARSAKLGGFLLRALSAIKPPRSNLASSVRGCGLLAGVELCRPDGSPATEPVLRALKQLLHRGFIFLPEGEHANVISFTPPLTISRAQLLSAVNAVEEILTTDERG